MPAWVAASSDAVEGLELILEVLNVMLGGQGLAGEAVKGLHKNEEAVMATLLKVDGTMGMIISS